MPIRDEALYNIFLLSVFKPILEKIRETINHFRDSRNGIFTLQFRMMQQAL